MQSSQRSLWILHVPEATTRKQKAPIEAPFARFLSQTRLLSLILDFGLRSILSHRVNSILESRFRRIALAYGDHLVVVGKQLPAEFTLPVLLDLEFSHFAHSLVSRRVNIRILPEKMGRTGSLLWL